MNSTEFKFIPVRPCIKCGASDRNEKGKCRPCKSASDARYRAKNQEKAKAYIAAYRELNKAELQKYAATYRSLNKGRFNDYQKKYYKDNADKFKESNAKYYAANAKQMNASAAAYRALNPDKCRELHEAYYKANKASCNQKSAAWQKANPVAVRIRAVNRRARKLQAGGRLSVGLSAKLFILQKGKCACCKKPLGNKYHLDHIIPLSRGGANTDENIQLLRGICNQQKSATDPVTFMQRRGFLL